MAGGSESATLVESIDAAGGAVTGRESRGDGLDAQPTRMPRKILLLHNLLSDLHAR
jgi:hypothetical protein